MSRTAALVRWPYAADMTEPVQGEGRWATVLWCGPLTVQLHAHREDAEHALRVMQSFGCGHTCRRRAGDHELVDVTGTCQPQPAERLLRRLRHFLDCILCRSVYNGCEAAARKRHRRPA